MQAIIKSSPQNALSPVLITLCLGVTCLIASEFIPVSLLSIIAEDLEISKGTAGQTVTAVGIVSFFSSLFLSSLFKNQDRRTLLLLLLAILVVSNLIIAFAFNVFSLFLGGSLGNQCWRFLVFIQRFGSKTYRTREIGSRVQHDAFRGFDSDDYRVAVRQLFVALYILADYFYFSGNRKCVYFYCFVFDFAFITAKAKYGNKGDKGTDFDQDSIFRPFRYVFKLYGVSRNFYLYKTLL